MISRFAEPWDPSFSMVVTQGDCLCLLNSFRIRRLATLVVGRLWTERPGFSRSDQPHRERQKRLLVRCFGVVFVFDLVAVAGFKPATL